MVLVLFFFQLSFAQRDVNGFRKGDKFLSGTLGYNTISEADGSKEINFRVAPRIGFFLNDFVAVGGKLGYGYLRRKNHLGQRTIENSTITGALFGRYYLFPGSKFSFFGELGVGFGSTRNIAKDWTNGVNAGFSPGISYFVSEHFALEAQFGLLSYNTVSPREEAGSTDSFSVGIDMSDIDFGIIFKF